MDNFTMHDDSFKPLDKPLPKRTSATNLTDDELLLLDALFQCHGIEAEQLFVDGYHWHMNVGYTHRLTDTLVLETLSRWDKQGWITPIADGVQGEETSRQWEMRGEGAMLWEQERRPVWDRFVRCWTYYSDLDDINYNDINYSGIDVAFLKASWEEPMTVIASPTLAIAEAYLATATAILIVEPRSPARASIVIHGDREAHKMFEELHCLFIPAISAVEDETEKPYVYTDWKTYERDRIWWNTIKELDTLDNREM
ncbi:MAG: hypothetical protein JWQ02_3465 [Capsulimonas sp.]|jgi:hypothetical protein|nr:hypothetical protein [Capsulimonas sp.]